MPIKPELLWRPRAIASDPWLRLPSYNESDLPILLRVSEIVGVQPISGGTQINTEQSTYYKSCSSSEVVIGLIEQAKAGARP